MTKHTYRLIMTMSVTDDGERQPGVDVAGAVSILIEDTAHEWLLEAIGHPEPDRFDIEVESFGD